MHKGSWITNKPIIADNLAVELGVLSDVLIDPRLGRIAAFTLKRSSREALIVLPWMGVKRIETEQVVAWASNMLVRADELFDIRQLFQQGIIQQGTRFSSIDHMFLGTMTDFSFDPYNGVIAHYELVGGPFVAAETETSLIPALTNTLVKPETDTAYLPLSFNELTHLINNTLS